MNHQKPTAKGILILTFLLIACTPRTAVRNDFAMTSDLNEQCKILNKKRHDQRSLTKFNGTVVRNKKKEVPRSSVPENKILRADIQQLITPAFLGTMAFQPPILPQQKKSEQIFAPVNTTPIPFQKKLVDTPGAFEAEKLYTASEESPKNNLNSLKKKSEGSGVFYILAISAVSSMLLISAAQKRSKRISAWASKNPWKARGIITATHISTGLCAIFIGSQFSDQGIIFSESSKYIALTFATAAMLIYPSRYTEKGYLKRKLCDVILFTSGAALMVHAGNQYSSIRIYDNPSAKASYSISSDDQAYSSIVKPTFQEPVKKKNTVGKILLTLLAVGIFIGLTFLLALLCCQIACSGNVAAAAVVGIGGEIGLIALLVFMIMSIFGKGCRKKKEEKQKVQLQEI